MICQMMTTTKIFGTRDSSYGYREAVRNALYRPILTLGRALLELITIIKPIIKEPYREHYNEL